MKVITLDEVIKENINNDSEFSEHYEKELLINAISKMIVELRKSAHLTQNELAKRVGTSQPVIARLESGCDSRLPSLMLLSKIAKASNAKFNIYFEIKE